jgi:hypothetical protein
MPLCAFSRAAAIIGVVLAGAASAQEPPLPSTYFFPDSNAAMAVAFLDPNISNETKRELAQLLEARRCEDEIDMAVSAWHAANARGRSATEC